MSRNDLLVTNSSLVKTNSSLVKPIAVPYETWIRWFPPHVQIVKTKNLETQLTRFFETLANNVLPKNTHKRIFKQLVQILENDRKENDVSWCSTVYDYFCCRTHPPINSEALAVMVLDKAYAWILLKLKERQEMTLKLLDSFIKTTENKPEAAPLLDEEEEDFLIL